MLKITFGIFDAVLNQSYETAHRGFWNRSEIIDDVLIWDGRDCSAERNVLYLNTDWEAYVKGKTRPTHVLCFVPASKKDSLEDAEGYFLFYNYNAADGGTPAPLNDCLRIFSELGKRLYDMGIICGMEHDIQKLMDLGSSYLKTNCVISNPAYEIEYFASPQKNSPLFTDEEKKGMSINEILMEETSFFHYDFESTFKEKGLAFFWNRTRSDVNCYYYNIFDNEEYLGRILLNVREPFRDEREQIYEYFASQIAECYIYNVKNNISGTSKGKLHKELQNLFSGGTYDGAEILEGLAKIGWEEGDVYEVIAFSTKGRVRTGFTLSYFCSKIEKESKASVAEDFDEKIICLHNLTRETENGLLSANNLPYFLRDNLFQAGISLSFGGIFKSASRVSEALAALRIGEAASPSLWIHHFSDLSFEYCLDRITGELPVEDLVFPPLKRIYEYDLKNPDTELAYTLYRYVENMFNAAKTARDLNIHRTTFLYRLEKARDIAHFDLDDPDTRTHIMLSYRMAPRLSEKIKP